AAYPGDFSPHPDSNGIVNEAYDGTPKRKSTRRNPATIVSVEAMEEQLTYQ
ncbi:short transient receptor potential channel 6, partial [Biomphalaria glabrata]